MNHQSIKTWAEADRPREKLHLHGSKSLSDSELIAIILGSGCGKKTALDLARELLFNADNHLGNLSKMSIKQLCTVKGIGLSKAISLLAALELSNRRPISGNPEKLEVSSSDQAYSILRPYLSDLVMEEFFCIFLNRANKVISVKQMSKGGYSGTIADGKAIFKAGIEIQAQGIILAHNHPSGNCKPSQSDKNLTQQLKNFGAMIDLPVLDHIIFTDNGYFSFVDEGMF